MKLRKTIAALTAAAVILSTTACTIKSAETSDSSTSSAASGSTAESGASTAEAGTGDTTEAEPVPSIAESGTPADTIAATPGNGAEGMDITFGDFLREYKYYLERSGYDNDTDGANADTIKQARQQIIDAIIEDRIVRAKFAEYGMSLSDEEEADIHSQVESGIASIKDSLKSTLSSADSSLTDDQLTEQAEQKFQDILDDCGLTMDVLYGWQEITAMKQKLTDEVGKDAVYTYEQAEEQMNTLIESLKSQYESDPATYYGQTYANIWIPEGSRAVKGILVGFNSTVYSLMQQLRSANRNDDADEYRQDKLADIQDKYDEIMAKINAGEEFDKLMEEYGEDGGNGTFLVTPGTEVYGKEFEECAMGIEKPGDVETAVTDFGYYIVKYVDEVTVNDDTLKASTQDLQAYLLQNEKSKLYSEEYEKWKNEYNFDISTDILGLD